MGHVVLLSEETLKGLEAQKHELSQQLALLTQTEKLYENKWWERRKDCHELYASTQAKKEIYDVQVDADLKLASQKQLLKHLDEFQTIREQFVLRQQADTELKTWINSFWNLNQTCNKLNSHNSKRWVSNSKWRKNFRHGSNM